MILRFVHNGSLRSEAPATEQSDTDWRFVRLRELEGSGYLDRPARPSFDAVTSRLIALASINEDVNPVTRAKLEAHDVLLVEDVPEDVIVSEERLGLFLRGRFAQVKARPTASPRRDASDEVYRLPRPGLSPERRERLLRLLNADQLSDLSD